MGSLIIVTGLPATGKSWLAFEMAKRLQVPVISKDDIKETMADSLGGHGDRDLSKRYGRASFAILFKLLDRCLSANTSVIAETYFHGDLAREAFEDLVSRHTCSPVQIVLRCDPEVIMQRFTNRHARGDRHAIHTDAAVVPEIQEALAAGEYRGIQIDCPTLVVDTTDFSSVNVESVRAFITQHS